ncbi:MAG: glycosyltransferase family 4 protein [Cyanobacteriota bacterium]
MSAAVAMAGGLRLALVSFEFPPALAIGGIGTYSAQAARMLAAAGAEVEVFCAGAEPPEGEPWAAPGLTIRRLPCDSRAAFRGALGPVLAERHRQAPFAVIESPELAAEAAEAWELCPGAALVVRLHTPTELLAELGWEPPSAVTRLRMVLGGLRRGRWVWARPPAPSAEAELERRFCAAAQLVVAPSQAIADLCGRRWALPPSQLQVVPNVFHPSPALLAMAPPRQLTTVGFLGRLETRKGIFDLAEAMARLLPRHPDLRLRLIGPSWPTARGEAGPWLQRLLRPWQDRVTLVGPVAADAVAAELARCDAVVLPSHWENFPNACWEAMAAARMVVGSAAGGMAEVIRDGEDGLLVPPRRPSAIVAALERLLASPAAAAAMALAARRRILDRLGDDTVLPLQLQAYRRAMARHQGAGAP